MEYIRVGTTATLTPWPCVICCATHCFSIQQPHTLNLADGDVSRVTWFQEVVAQVPESSVAKASQLQRTYGVISSAYLHLWHLGLTASPGLSNVLSNDNALLAALPLLVLAFFAQV
jgi:hypothetical protein